MSMTLLEQMKSSVTSQFIGYAAKLLGETPANIEKAVGLALPAILSGTASASHVASSQAGQSVVSRLVADPVNDGTLLHRLPALYQGTMTAAPIYRLGAQLLQAIFGSKLGKVTQTIAALSGIKPASSALLVNTLAPHVLAILGKRHRMSGESTASGLAHLFDAEHASLAASVPAALSQLIGTPVAAHATAGAGPASAAKSAKPALAVTTPVKASAMKEASSVAAQTAAAKVVEHRPTVTQQSYKWSSWLPVLAMYGLGAGGLALILTSQTDTQSPNPVTGVKSAQVSPSVPAPAASPSVTAPAKTSEAAKTAEAAKTSAPAKTSEAVTKPATPTPAPATTTPPKTAEVGKPEVSKPAVTVPAPPVAATPPKTVEVTKPAVTAPVAPVPLAPAPPPGTTSFFGTTPPLPEVAAKMNPDYKPAAEPAANSPAKQVAAASPTPAAPATAPAPAAPITLPVSPKGVTSFFGVTPPVAESAAQLNPDYKPSIPAPVAEASSQPAPVAQPTTEPAAKAAKAPDAKPTTPVPSQSVSLPSVTSLPGVTSYFGTASAPAEQAAIPNPDYRPAPEPIKEPSFAQAALAAVTNLITPAPPRPSGVTSYYGSTPANQEAAARPNPDYKPSATPPPSGTKSTAAVNQATPPSAAPAIAPTASVAACRTSVANAVKKGRIIFQSARADLKTTSIATLDRLATAFKACPDARLKVEGHTDSTGLPETNQKLSLARAQTVASYLAQKGIDSARVLPVGMGSARPVAPNTTTLNKARNRRIEFTVENP